MGWLTKAGLLLLRILNLWWGTQIYVVLDNYETKNSLDVLFTKMQTCFSKETKLPTDQSNICFLDEKQCVYRGMRVCWWNFLITVNEILDVSISFLNDHLEEALSSTKIEENHSKCINLTQVSFSSEFRTIDMSWLDFANHFLSNQRLHAWSWINRTFLEIFLCGNFGFECSWLFPFLFLFSVRWTSHRCTGFWLAIKGRGPF